MSPGKQIANIEFRLPLHGRIRTGIKGPKGWPESIKTFRFTSSDKQAIDQIAGVYGGTPKPWANGKDPEFEVITQSKDLNVILPPDPLSGPTWEFWQKGGKLYDCDGVTCDVRVQGPDGPDWDEQPCLCEANSKRVCKPTSRLKVLLPDVDLGGAWMLATGSFFAAVELPGMVQLVQMIHSATLTPARLVLEARTAVKDGKTKHFNVPVLRTKSTIVELMSMNEMNGIGSEDLLELGEEA
tara:strand:- start:16736 stop:17455 length:720 start_codon:yes stop_codon:yes gene_type:complete